MKRFSRCLQNWCKQRNASASYCSPKRLALRIAPPNSGCYGTAPVTVINMKFSGNMPSLVLGKVMKFHTLRFGDIPEKPEGWMKTPPATNTVNASKIENPTSPPLPEKDEVSRKQYFNEVLSNALFI